MSLPLIVTAAAVLALPRVQYTEAQRTQQIKSLPGAPQVDFKMFSGYVNIGVRGKLFFWFVESQSATAATDPVLLWTNGGPGCSGLVGFLTENGPFRPTEKGNLTLNPTAWNTLANMVYIEQPVGVGFSVASGKLKYSDAQAAEDNLNFLKGFFKLFPQYDHNRFYLTSESCERGLPNACPSCVGHIPRPQRAPLSTLPSRLPLRSRRWRPLLANAC